VFDASKVGDEIFGILRSFDYEVAIFDDEGNKVYEPGTARRFFTNKRNITVALHEDGENSKLLVYLGRSVEMGEVEGLLNTLRKCANKFGLLYSARQYRRELLPRDFTNGATVLESRKLTGSSKTSYLKLEGARMIVRHDSAVDDSKQGARGRNVRKVFVENREGERFLMPSQNMMAGRAMTRHVSESGDFRDEVGTKICEMAKQQVQMKTCASYCRKNRKKIDEDVSPIIDACTTRASKIRETFEGLYRRYAKTLTELEKNSDDLLCEGSDDMLEEKVNALREKLKLEDDNQMDRPTCETVVRLLGENSILEARGPEMVHLPALDCDVEAEAWEAFKADEPKITFINDTAPDVTPASDNLAAGLTLVANQVKHDAFANMLSQVSQWLEDGKTDALLKHIAHRAIHVAKTHPSKAEAKPLVKTPSVDKERVPESKKALDGVIVTESVKALEEWFAGLSPDKIFEDDWGSRHPRSVSDDEYSTELGKSISTVEDDFNVDDFLVMRGDDFNYGDSTITEKEIEADYLRKSLMGYLNDEVEDDFSASVEVSHDDFGDLSDVVSRLMPQVVSRLEEEGYTISGFTAEADVDVAGTSEPIDPIVFRDDILDENIGDFRDESIPEETREIAKKLHRANYEPVRYSGRAMMGEECLGVVIEWKSEVDELADALGEEYGDPHIDGMGRGFIAYWPHLKLAGLNEDQAEDVEDDGLDDDKELLLSGDGDDDLSNEDILLPSNPATDLEREVSSDGETKADGDADYINRLKTLAGVKGARAPRPPQP
jgi:hypothetical protein